MRTDTKLADRRSATTTHRSIDRSIQALTTELQQESNQVPATMSERIARLMKIYEAVEPLLRLLSTIQFIPTHWRRALALFNDALAAIVVSADGLDVADFKAGKDL